MSRSGIVHGALVGDPIPAELRELKERIQAQPPEVRAVLEPLVDDAMEHAQFRGRAMSLARDALSRFRLDLAMMEFDLEATLREREDFRFGRE
jgi:hypothetical protein